MNNRSQNMAITRNQLGFTMMELMIATAIFAILSAIAIPSLIGWIPDYKLRSAARDVVSVLQTAKLRAVKDNVRVVVIFSSVTESYTAFIDNVPAGGNWALDASESIVKQETLPSGIEIDTSRTFGYNGRGLLDGAINNILLRNTKADTMTISVNLAGSITVQ